MKHIAKLKKMEDVRHKHKWIGQLLSIASIILFNWFCYWILTTDNPPNDHGPIMNLITGIILTVLMNVTAIAWIWYTFLERVYFSTLKFKIIEASLWNGDEYKPYYYVSEKQKRGRYFLGLQ